nr:MAG TPA: hypothetical protein [Caudoviricetes sp.]
MPPCAAFLLSVKNKFNNKLNTYAKTTQNI